MHAKGRLRADQQPPNQPLKAVSQFNTTLPALTPHNLPRHAVPLQSTPFLLWQAPTVVLASTLLLSNKQAHTHGHSCPECHPARAGRDTTRHDTTRHGINDVTSASCVGRPPCTFNSSFVCYSNANATQRRNATQWPSVGHRHRTTTERPNERRTNERTLTD